MKKFKSKFTLILALIGLYLGIASGVYRFRHPEYTSPQVLYKIKDVVLWR